MRQKKYDELYQEAKRRIIKATHGMPIGNLRYWVGCKTMRGVVPERVWKQITQQLQDEGCVFEDGAVFINKRSEGYKAHRQLMERWEAIEANGGRIV